MAVPAVERFVAAATALGLEPKIKMFPQDTRTAQQAADALGCQLGQIVKSLIFKAGDELVLVLTSGVNRVDVAKAAPLASQPNSISAKGPTRNFCAGGDCIIVRLDSFSFAQD